MQQKHKTMVFYSETIPDEDHSGGIPITHIVRQWEDNWIESIEIPGHIEELEILNSFASGLVRATET